MCHGDVRLRVRPFVLLAALISAFFFYSSAHAATYFWANPGGGDWNTANNWSTQEKGAGAAEAGFPGAGDTAVLSFSGGTITLDAAVSTQNIILKPNWTGSLVAGGYAITATGSVRVGSGRLIGSAANFAIGGNYTQTGGILRSFQGNLSLSGALTVRKGAGSSISSFSCTGTLILSGAADQDFGVGTNTSFTLGGLTVRNSGGGTSDDIPVDMSGAWLNLSGALVITVGDLDLETNHVEMNLEGNMTIANTAQATFVTGTGMIVNGNIASGNAGTFTMSGGTLQLNGSADQTVDFNGVSIWSLAINNSGGGTSDDIIVSNSSTLLANSPLLLSGSLTITNGNLDLATNTEALIVEQGITLADDADATLSTDSNVTASGSVTVNNAATWSMSAGSLTLTGGAETLNLDGQTIPNLVLASSAPTTLGDHLTVSTALQVNTGATLTFNTYTLTGSSITITNYGTLTQGTGKLSHTASDLLLANSSYARIVQLNSSDTAYFTLTDSDGNVSGTAADTLTLTVTLASGDSESVTLTETSKTSGVFRGSIASAKQAAATTGTLESATDSTISVSYTDAQDGQVLTTSGVFSTGTTTTTTGGGGGGSRGGSGGGGGGGGTAAPKTFTPDSAHVKEEVKNPVIKSAKDRRLEARKRALERRKARAELRNRRLNK